MKIVKSESGQKLPKKPKDAYSCQKVKKWPKVDWGGEKMFQFGKKKCQKISKVAKKDASSCQK